MYINNQTFGKTLLISSLVSFVGLTSCKKDDNKIETPTTQKEGFLIDAKGTEKSFALYVSD